MMKKILALALIAGMMLTGCSKKEEPVPTPSATPEITPTPESDSSESGLSKTVSDVLANYELPGFMNVTSAEVKDLYSIDPEEIEEMAIYKPMMNVHATEIIVITAKEGKLESVKEAVEAYMSTQEENWSTYLPEQYELVQNRIVKEVGNTLIVVVAEEAEKIAADLEAALQ